MLTSHNQRLSRKPIRWSLALNLRSLLGDGSSLLSARCFFWIGFQVDVSGFNTRMTQPERNHGQIDPRLKQVHAVVCLIW